MRLSNIKDADGRFEFWANRSSEEPKVLKYFRYLHQNNQKFCEILFSHASRSKLIKR